MKTNTKHWASITAGILSLAGYASAASLGSEKYTYDASGNMIEKSIDGQATKMAYDNANRLIGRHTNDQSRETTTNDSAGRPITTKDRNGQITRSMSYGYGGKVLETQNQVFKAGFYYNAEGQLVGTLDKGVLDVFVWDGLAMVARSERVFANEANLVGGAAVLSGSDVVVSDMIGSTLSVGSKKYSATAYGEGLEEGFMTGKPFVAELNGFAFLHRNYSSEFVRWTTPDPSGYPDGKNNFIYVNNDPLIRYDALGLTSDTWGIDVESFSGAHTAEISVTVTTSYMTSGTPTASTTLVEQNFGPGYKVVQGSIKGNWNAASPSATNYPASPKNYSKVVNERMNASLTVFKVENGQEFKADLTGNKIVTTDKAYEQ